MSAAPIGMLNLGDTFLVAQVKETNGEIWVQLDQVSVFCPKMTATNALAYFEALLSMKKIFSICNIGRSYKHF